MVKPSCTPNFLISKREGEDPVAEPDCPPNICVPLFLAGGGGWCSKITADGDCSHEIKTHLVLGRKAMTNLDSILKNRDIHLPKKVHLVKAMVFPVVIYRREN